MIKYHYYALFSLLFFGVGMIFFALRYEFLVLRHPLNTTDYQPAVQHSVKKTVNLIFWHNGTFKTETRELLWSENKETNLNYLISNWLDVLDEEQAIHKKVTLQTALLAPSGHEAYISFDRNPLPKQCAAFEKLMWLEGLLKTLRENDMQLQGIYFLVHHQPLNDPHLDFSNPWPLSGFIAK